MKSLKQTAEKYKRIIFVLIFVIVILIVITIATAGRSQSTTNLTIEKVQTRNVERKVTADGFVEGIDSRVVFLNPNFKVTEVRYKVGDSVNKDDVLAVLTSSDGRSTNLEVKSPISGVVTEVNYKVNDIVSAVNSAGFSIVDKSSYKIELVVNENDIVDLKPGQKAKIIYSAISIDQTYGGEVILVSPDSIPGTSAVSYKVLVTPQEIPESLKLGMSANVEITTAVAENVLSIPESFVIEKEDKTFLKFVNRNSSNQDEYTLEEREVSLGLQTDEYVEIKSGVNEGDEIVEPNFEPRRITFFPQ